MEVADQVIQVLEAIASRIQGPAEHVWSVLVQQQFYHGVYDAIFCILFLIGAAVLFYLAYKAAKSDKSNNTEEGFFVFLFLTGCGILGVVTALLIGDHFYFLIGFAGMLLCILYEKRDAAYVAIKDRQGNDSGWEVAIIFLWPGFLMFWSGYCLCTYAPLLAEKLADVIIHKFKTKEKIK